MIKTTLPRSLKTLTSALVSGTILMVAMNTQAAISQSPLSLTVGVPPNLILTLDDSGSMRWAFIPDGGADSDSRRAKSSAHNPMYYNPAVTYDPPPRFSANGQPYTPTADETPSFSNALSNGFVAARGSYNLAADYRVTWSYDIGGPMDGNTLYGYTSGSVANRFALNPLADFSRSVAIATNGASATASAPGITFTITRVSSSSCTATASYTGSSSNLPVRCTGSGGTFTVNLAQAALTTGNQDFTTATRTVDLQGLRFIITRTGTRSCTATVSTIGGSQNIPTYCHSPSSNRFVATYSGVPAYYYAHNGNENCAKTNDNCYELRFVSAAERQNFANWYSYYRNRALATVSAASVAFAELPSSTRLTWQALNNCSTLNSTSSCSDSNNLFREYDLTQRGRLFSWMQNMPFSGSTPLPAALKRAGEFLRTEDIAWQKFPNGTGNTGENTYACRPSYHILMTDGMWNNSTTNPPALRADHGTFDLPDGTKYSGDISPFADTTTGTLADLAMHYWATDLSTLPDRIKPYYVDNSTTPLAPYWNPRNNPATWQHMVNFTVGLGLSESLNFTDLPWDAERGAFGGTGYNNLVNGTAWPPTAASAPNNANNAYDLWHAAINSRGDFFSADSPETVVQAFVDIMSRIASRTATASRPAMNSSVITEDGDDSAVTTVSYQTSYSSEENWSGDLTRTEQSIQYNAASNAFETTNTTRWKASEQLPDASARRIFIPSDTSANGLQPFTWSNAGSAAAPGTLANFLSRNPEAGNVLDSRGEARLNFLRGDRSEEGTTFRNRSSVLGDLYSSTPVSVFRPRYLISRGNQLGPLGAYTSFANSIANRTPRIYVGGNDGMLHGFNAQTGAEEFAFIPSAVFPTLNKLTGTNYTHQFYVDGSPVVADVYDGTEWRTILVGTLRAGGKSVFALDITEPGNERLLWEFDDSKITTAGAVKMGHSFSKPTVARLPSSAGNPDSWAVVFGNGYEADGHTDGRAALFVLDAMDGTLLKSLEVSGTAGIANGLSTPKLSDYNDDGIAEYAYAGDLQGNLWRFNLYQTSADAYNVAYGSRPMFSAYNTDVNGSEKAQAITSAPSLVRHPSGKGYLVIFGTGKYFEDTDKDGDKSTAQTVYGIWDRHTGLFPDDIAASSTPLSIDRSNLATQTIIEEDSGTDPNGASVSTRKISNNGFSWTAADGTDVMFGWALDLKVGSVLDGEMVVDDMVTFGRSTLLFQSLIPNDDPCGDGASSWVYGINAHTGGRLNYDVFGITKDGVPDPDVGGKRIDDGGGEGGVTVSQKPSGQYQICTGTSCSPIQADPSSVGRQTWRLIERF